MNMFSNLIANFDWEIFLKFPYNVLLPIALWSIVAIISFPFIIITKILKARRLRKKEKFSKVAKTEIFSNNKTRLDAINNTEFTRKPILNSGELIAFNTILSYLEEKNSSLILCTQIPIISMVKEYNHRKFPLAGGMYCDFVLMNKDALPIVVIEIDGKGHSKEKDDIKDKILKKAGIKIIRVDTRDWNKAQKTYRQYVSEEVISALKKGKIS